MKHLGFNHNGIPVFGRVSFRVKTKTWTGSAVTIVGSGEIPEKQLRYLRSGGPPKSFWESTRQAIKARRRSDRSHHMSIPSLPV